jgi:predicted branched-subunit amino acid permease
MRLPRDLLSDPHARRGSADMLHFAPGIGAWGIVTGVAMVKSGLSVPLAVLMSLVVYAGSAQLASLPLIAAGAPVWVVWGAAMCVNLRFVIFSAQWRVFLEHLPRWKRLGLAFFAADLNLMAFQRAWPSGRREPGQIAYFVGNAATGWVVWQATSLTGILLGDAVPTEWGLGFAGTLAMLGLTYGLLRDRVTWTAGIVAGCAAVAAYALPLKLNIAVAIAAAIAVGLMADQAERALKRMGSA